MLADIGNVAPSFTLISSDNERVTLSQYRGDRHVVLSFHVFDFTGGCTTQTSSFASSYDQIEEKGAQVLGISCDTAASHRAWADSMGGLPYPLLSDFHPKGQVCEAYGLYDPRSGASRVPGSGVTRVEGLDEERPPRHP